jgi:hypothetical protein
MVMMVEKVKMTANKKNIKKKMVRTLKKNSKMVRKLMTQKMIPQS